MLSTRSITAIWLFVRLGTTFWALSGAIATTTTCSLPPTHYSLRCAVAVLRDAPARGARC